MSDLSTETKREAAKYKLRKPNGKVAFPINDCSDVADAWGLRGNSSLPKAKVEAYIRRTASKLNCKIPGDKKTTDFRGEIWTDLWSPSYTFSMDSGTPLSPGLSGPHQQWVQYMPRGVYQHPVYGEMNFNEKFFKELKSNFDNKVRRVDPAMDKDHAIDGNTEALAWFKEVEIKPDGLWVLMEFTPLGYKLVHQEKRYRYFSPEWGAEEDEATGQVWDNVIKGGAATNRPFLRDLQPLAASELWWAKVGDNAGPGRDSNTGDKQMGDASALVPSIPQGDKFLPNCPSCGQPTMGAANCPSCGYKMTEQNTDPGNEGKVATEPKSDPKASKKLAEADKKLAEDNKKLSERIKVLEAREAETTKKLKEAEVDRRIAGWQGRDVPTYALNEAGEQEQIGTVKRVINPAFAKMYRDFKLSEAEHTIEDFIDFAIDQGAVVETGERGTSFELSDPNRVSGSKDLETKRLKGEEVIVEGGNLLRAAEAWALSHNKDFNDLAVKEEAFKAAERGATMNGSTPHSY